MWWGLGDGGAALARHFRGLEHSLVHGGVHGVGVGAATLVIARVGAGPALVGVRAAAAALVGV